MSPETIRFTVDLPAEHAAILKDLAGPLRATEGQILHAFTMAYLDMMSYGDGDAFASHSAALFDFGVRKRTPKYRPCIELLKTEWGVAPVVTPQLAQP